jgi:hypothetical protein
MDGNVANSSAFDQVHFVGKDVRVNPVSQVRALGLPHVLGSVGMWKGEKQALQTL